MKEDWKGLDELGEGSCEEIRDRLSKDHTLKGIEWSKKFDDDDDDDELFEFKRELPNLWPD